MFIYIFTLSIKYSPFSFNVSNYDSLLIEKLFNAFNLEINNVYDKSIHKISLNDSIKENIKKFGDTCMKKSDKEKYELYNRIRKIDVDTIYLFISQCELDSSEIQNKVVYFIVSDIDLKQDIFDNKNFKFRMENYKIKTTMLKANEQTHYYGDSSERYCKYCGNKIEKNARKERSHIIPQSLGNNIFFDAEECKECNSKFGEGIDQDLIKYLSIFGTILGISGKKGVPEFKDSNSHKIKFETIKGQNNVSLYANDISDENGELKIKYEIEFIPKNMYRALAKMALGLIETKDIGCFENTIKWIKDISIIEDAPSIVEYNIEDEDGKPMFLSDTRIHLYIRANSNKDIPYAIGEFYCQNKIFVYIIPFTNNDNKDFWNSKNSGNFYKENWDTNNSNLKPRCFTLNKDDKHKITYNFTLENNTKN